jgi:hypothetical protein
MAKPVGAHGAAGPVSGPPAARQHERLVYAARPNVCGTGDGIVIRNADGSTTHVTGLSHRVELSQPWTEGDPPCEAGVVVVDLEGPVGARTGVRVAVTEEERAMGEGADPFARLAADVAAKRLLFEARTTRDRRAARRLVMAAALADTEVWPALLELGRDRSLSEGTRKAALHWLGRAAAESAAAALGGIVGDPTEEDEIREAAVFALAQQPADRAVPLLIEVARSTGSARLRSRALFWLADFDDPRALSFIEEILAGSG